MPLKQIHILKLSLRCFRKNKIVAVPYFNYIIIVTAFKSLKNYINTLFGDHCKSKI